MHLLSDLRLAKEIARRQNAQVTEFLQEALIFLKDFGVHYVGRDIRVCDVLAILLTKFRLDLLKIERGHSCAWPAINAWLVANDPRAKRFREASVRLSKVSLEEFYYGRGEVKMLCFLQDILIGQLIGHHKLCKVSDDLGRGSDFDDVPALDQSASFTEYKDGKLTS